MVTAAVVVAPAWWPDRDVAAVARVEELLPAYLLAVLAVCVGSAVAAGGGREVLARDASAIHPVGPFTDHLGALVLAPLSAAWLLQAWCLLGATAWVVGPHPSALLVAESAALLWVGCATALGHAVGWWVEWLRRGPHGAVVVRGLVAATVLVVGGSVTVARDAMGDLGGPGPPTLPLLAALLMVLPVLVVLDGHAARLAAGRAPRDEARLESRTYQPRRAAGSDLSAFVRIDRGSVWRSVPVRRGVVFLTVAPGLVALAHPMSWDTLVVLPGLVVSGCVLLFGVNIWALEGRGMLWREALPVAPSAPLLARGWVLAELLLGAGALTMVLGAVRAGPPPTAYAVAAGAALLVVTGQALSGGLRWSSRSPQAVDYRSARATPAPPLTMVGYSVRLALATTTTTMLLGALAGLGRTDLVVALAAILVAVSTTRLALVARRWADPVRRSRVVAVVAA